MLRKIKRLYDQYRGHVRVDLILYSVLIAMIIIYSIWSMINAARYLSKSF
jgi:hypothetical protein